jgi:hypothetical protein
MVFGVNGRSTVNPDALSGFTGCTAGGTGKLTGVKGAQCPFGWIVFKSFHAVQNEGCHYYYRLIKAEGRRQREKGR